MKKPESKPELITLADLATVTGGGRLSIPHTPGSKKRASGVVN